MNDSKCYDRINKKHKYKELQNLYTQKKYKSFIREAASYLETYKDDGVIRYLRAKAYRQMEQFDLAIEDLKYNLTFSSQTSTLFSLFYIYYYLKRYKEALELLPILYKISPDLEIELNVSKAVIQKNLGINELQILKPRYTVSQIYNYDKNLVLKHLKKHLNGNSNNPNTSYFYDNVDIDYLFESVLNNLKTSKRENVEDTMDIYYFLVHNIGIINNTPCNCIKVVVIPNTTNILNIFPAYGNDNQSNILNCDYDKLYKRNAKSLTKIKKFNEKYNR